MAVVGPEEAAALSEARTALAAGLQPTPRPSIATMMARLANIYRAERLSPEEANARLETYCALLEDIPPDLLLVAFRKVGQSLKFFPTVAELREPVEAELRKRRNLAHRAAWLIRIHQERWRPPVEPLGEEERKRVAEEARQILHGLDGRFPSARTAGPLSDKPSGPITPTDSNAYQEKPVG